MLERISDAQTNAGKHVMSNLACERSQRKTQNSLLIGPYDIVHYDIV